MNKNKVSIIVLVVAVMAILAVVIGVVIVGASPKTPPVVEDFIEDNGIAKAIEIRDRRSKIENSKKNINTTIPEFQNLENAFQDSINNKIYKDLNDVNVYNYATEGLEEDEIGKFTYEVDYERYNSDKYLSIVASQYIHLGDGRPRIQKKCYVIDAERNASVILEDLFGKKYEYETAIIKEINAQAARSGLELIGGNGLSELSKNQAYYIKDNKLIIYFEASEIAATAVGELEFIMPFEMVDGKFVI